MQYLLLAFLLVSQRLVARDKHEQQPLVVADVGNKDNTVAGPAIVGISNLLSLCSLGMGMGDFRLFVEARNIEKSTYTRQRENKKRHRQRQKKKKKNQQYQDEEDEGDIITSSSGRRRLLSLLQEDNKTLTKSGDKLEFMSDAITPEANECRDKQQQQPQQGDDKVVILEDKHSLLGKKNRGVKKIRGSNRFYSIASSKMKRTSFLPCSTSSTTENGDDAKGDEDLKGRYYHYEDTELGGIKNLAPDSYYYGDDGNEDDDDENDNVEAVDDEKDDYDDNSDIDGPNSFFAHFAQLRNS